MATERLTQALCPGSLFLGEQGTMAQNLYGPGVRMGNWNEDVYLEEVRREWPGTARPLPGDSHAWPKFGPLH